MYGVLSVSKIVLFWITCSRYVYREVGLFYTEVGLFYTEVGIFYTEVGIFYTEVGLFYTEVGIFHYEVGLFCNESGFNLLVGLFIKKLLRLGCFICLFRGLPIFFSSGYTAAHAQDAHVVYCVQWRFKRTFLEQHIS